jgi:hypothetical protein
VKLSIDAGPIASHALAVGFFIVSYFFVRRSFYGMRMPVTEAEKTLSSKAG